MSLGFSSLIDCNLAHARSDMAITLSVWPWMSEVALKSGASGAGAVDDLSCCCVFAAAGGSVGNANDDGLRVFCVVDDDGDVVVVFHLIDDRRSMQGCDEYSILLDTGVVLIMYLKLIFG